MRETLSILAEKYRWFQNIICYEENKTNLGSFLLEKALRNMPLKPLKEKRSQVGNVLAKSPHSLRAQGRSMR